MNFTSVYYLEAHASVIKCFRNVIVRLLLHEGSTSWALKKHRKTKNKAMNVKVTQQNKNHSMIERQLSVYLADRTYTFAFPAQTFSGLRALQSMLTVGTLPTINCVVASDTLPTWDPL